MCCRTRALVLELLAAICLVTGGHEIILQAFDFFKEVSRDLMIIENMCHVAKNEIIWT